MAFKLTEKQRKYDGKDPTQGKVYRFFDWVWKLFIINALSLICSLGVITFIPSVVAGFRTIKDCYEEDESHYIKKYFQNFLFCFKDTVIIGILVLLLYGVLFYAYVFYSEVIREMEEAGNLESYINLYSILLSLIILFFLILTIVVIQIPVAVTYFHLRFFDKIKFAFYMTFKHFGITLCLFLILSISGMLMLFWPPYIFLFSFSIPLYIIYLLTRKPYWAVANMMEYEEEEDEYDLQNKSQVREDYEDNKISIQDAEKQLEEINKKITGGNLDD